MFNCLSTEACPFCRRVREAITELDLSVEVSNGFHSMIAYQFFILVIDDSFISKFSLELYFMDFQGFELVTIKRPVHLFPMEIRI